ncbi:MAG: hypothetical protein J6J17_02320 [Bacilli bacterium]|nr:hypothetical protein [Bacilli bacterium]
MKIDNKGFVTSIILFSLLILFLVVFFTLLITIDGSSKINTIIKKDIQGKLENSSTSVLQKVWIFEYTGAEEVFKVPENGIYKLETWGAQGGSFNTTYIGGLGGYSKGEIKLNEGETLYINVGGKGSSYSKTTISLGGYNGGGDGGVNSVSSSMQGGCGGGGATHIATESGLLSSLSKYAGDNNSPILIVAGGGGGPASLNETDNAYIVQGENGSGGGIKGASGGYASTYPSYYATGATQTSGGNDNAEASETSKGTFGKGGSAFTSFGGNGGGGGYYGGGGSSRFHSGAGGGSGYIENSRLLNSLTQNGVREGNGYVKITYLGN